MEKPPFHLALAAKLIDQLERGTAPWQKPWEAGVSHLPFNPVTGKNYKGLNAVQLLSEGCSDPRWMTYRQAAVQGGQVRRGERGTPIQYWKFEEERALRDPAGKPLHDDQGRERKKIVTLDQPRVFFATVFNAAQIEGLAPPERRPVPAWSAEQAAEARMALATVRHDQADRAFYLPRRDEIHLPARAQFADAASYYHVGLHELAHWSGHASRLDRDLSNPPGSPEYAREELRAEIASLLMGAEIGTGHAPNENAAAYVSHWVQDLRERPLEILRAAADAEKIRGLVAELTQQRSDEAMLAPSTVEPMPAPTPVAKPTDRPAPAVGAAPRVYLAVPYGEKNTAHVLGAKWDAEKKLWYAPGPEAAQKLARWRPENQVASEGATLSPREEFADALRGLDFRLGSDHPILDGKPHRVPTPGDQRGEAAGFYVGYGDGHPAGYAINNRTGEEVRWKAKGYLLSAEQRQALTAGAANRLAAREQQTRDAQAEAARRVEAQLRGAEPATFTPYLAAKQIEASHGVFADREARTLLVPGYDTEGTLWTAQYINEDGSKRFVKGTRKQGCFHVVGGMAELNRREIIIVAEGYATANTIAAATDGRAAVASAFDAGNLEPVARALRERYPDKPMLIAADDDRRGQEDGIKAARAAGAECLSPVFAVGEQSRDPDRFSDFNDLKVHSALGLDGLREQLSLAMDRAAAQVTEQGQGVTREESRPAPASARSGRGGSLREEGLSR